MTDLDTDVRTDERTDRQLDDGGDHDRFSHYVKKKKLMPSMVEGTPLEALCGKKWVPSRDPQRYPVCPTCKDIYEKMRDPKKRD